MTRYGVPLASPTCMTSGIAKCLTRANAAASRLKRSAKYFRLVTSSICRGTFTAYIRPPRRARYTMLCAPRPSSSKSSKSGMERGCETNDRDSTTGTSSRQCPFEGSPDRGNLSGDWVDGQRFWRGSSKARMTSAKRQLQLTRRQCFYDDKLVAQCIGSEVHEVGHPFLG